MNTPPNSWPITLTVLSAGAVCGVQIAKLGPALPQLMATLDMSLTQAGILASTFSLLTLIIGAMIGNIMPNIGPRRMVMLAMLCSISGSLLALASAHSSALMIGRSLEGIGLVIMMIAGPTLVSMYTKLTERAKHMGVWAAFMPAGTAISFFVAPSLLPSTGWQGLWMLSLVLAVIALGLSYRYIPADQKPARLALDRPRLRQSWAQKNLLWLGALFAVHSMIFHVILQFIPLYSAQTLDLAPHWVSYAVGVFCLLNCTGNLLAGYALHHGLRSDQLMTVAFLAAPLIAAGLFWPGLAVEWRALTLLAGAFFTSLTPSATFLLVNRMTREPAQIPSFNGMMLQVQGAGILLGPALIGWIVDQTHSWAAAGWLIAGFALLALAIVQLKIRPLCQPVKGTGAHTA